MTVQPLSYEADGLQMSGRLALPQAGGTPRPAVLVFPHAFGPGEHSLGKAQRLADELGYVALECDLYGGAKTGGIDEIGELMRPMRESADTVRRRTQGPWRRSRPGPRSTARASPPSASASAAP